MEVSNRNNITTTLVILIVAGAILGGIMFDLGPVDNQDGQFTPMAPLVPGKPWEAQARPIPQQQLQAPAVPMQTPQPQPTIPRQQGFMAQPQQRNDIIPPLKPNKPADPTPKEIPITQNAAKAVQDEINRAVSLVRPAVVMVETIPGLNQPIDQEGLSLIHPFNNGRRLVGSGVIVDPAGYVLTSFQSVGRSTQVKVTPYMTNKRQFLADVVSVDEATDLALLRINSNEQFNAAILGNSDSLEVGDLVFALGSPFGFARSVTMGIVSTHQRKLEVNGIRYPDVIQTDASINDGDDGGPLINIKGEVIGIAAAYYVPGQHYTGIGFAIPINDAKNIIARK